MDEIPNAVYIPAETIQSCQVKLWPYSFAQMWSTVTLVLTSRRQMRQMI